MSAGVLGWVRQCTIEHATPVPTDHRCVALQLQVPASVCTGPGLRRIPPTAYDDPAVRALVQARLQVAQAEAAGPAPPDVDPAQWQRVLWRRTKTQLREVVLDHLERQRELRRAQRRAWARAARFAAQHLLQLAGVQSDPQRTADLIASAAAAAASPHSRTAARADDLMAAGAVLNHFYNDRPSFYFHSKARAPHPPVTVRWLAVEPGPVTFDLSTAVGTDAALAQFAHHYSADNPGGVFAARPCDLAARARLLAIPAPKLSAAQAALDDGVLTADHLTRALAACQRGTAAGEDGLSVEFYLQFWDLVVPMLVAALREAFEDFASPAPLSDFLLGIITLVPKPNKPADRIAGYRPITLLDMDMRIIARAVADRLQVPLDLVVAATQTAFINGRDISDNIQYHLSLADYLQQRAPATWVCLWDLAGAYDRVDWGLLADTMRSMGFRSGGHVRWAQLLHRGAASRVCVNGWLSPQFPLASGLLQGSGASPLYWCIVLQPLSTYLTSLAVGGRILTPTIPQSVAAQSAVHLGPAPPAHHYADDGQSVGSVPASVETQAAAYDEWAATGGPSISLPKSVDFQVVPQAPVHGDQPAAPAGIPVGPAGTPQRLLGVPLGPGVPHAQQLDAAFGGQPMAMSAAARAWAPVQLTLPGRVHVAKQCLISKVVFQLAYLHPTAAQIQPMQKAVRDFVAGHQRQQGDVPAALCNTLHPAQHVIALPVRQGGLGYPMLDTFATAMQAKSVAHLVGPRVRPWQAIWQQLLADQWGVFTWVVTAPRAVHLPDRLSRIQDHVTAFSQLHVHRVVPYDKQSFFSIMAEPLFYNPAINLDMPRLLDPDSGPFIAAPQPRAWRALRDVYSTMHSARPHSLAVSVALQLVLAALPAPWQAALHLHPPPLPLWMCAPAPQQPGYPPTFVVRCADQPNQPSKSYWMRASGELMELLPGGVAPVGGQVLPLQALVWEPAAVVAVKKPARMLTAEEQRDQRLPPGQRPPWPTSFFFLGPWATVSLDPQVWGWSWQGLDRETHSCNLAHYTVKGARLRLTNQAYQLHAAAAPGAAYAPGIGAWPRLWGARPAAPPAAAPGQPEPQVQYDTTGITTLEAAWQAAYAARQRQELVDDGLARPAGERDAAVNPAWMRLQGEHPARPPPHPRGPPAPVAPAPAAPTVGVPCCSAWLALQHPALRVPHRTVAWLVMHGALMVRAFQLYCSDGQVLPASHGHCPVCRAGDTLAQPQLETLTHAFMDCPAVAAALDWLRDVYAALTGQPPPPRDPLVVLGGAHWRWSPAAGPHHDLWLLLRVTFMGCAWAARCAGMLGHGGPRAVVSAVISALSDGLVRDWARVTSDVTQRAVGLVPLVWFRGLSPKLERDDFARMWPACGDWYTICPQGLLTVRLSHTWPIQAPA